MIFPLKPPFIRDLYHGLCSSHNQMVVAGGTPQHQLVILVTKMQCIEQWHTARPGNVHFSPAASEELGRPALMSNGLVMTFSLVITSIYIIYYICPLVIGHPPWHGFSHGTVTSLWIDMARFSSALIDLPRLPDWYSHGLLETPHDSDLPKIGSCMELHDMSCAVLLVQHLNMQQQVWVIHGRDT